MSGKLMQLGILISYSLSSVELAPIQLISRMIVGRLCSNMQLKSSIALSCSQIVYFIPVLRLELALCLAFASFVFIIKIFKRVIYVSQAGLLSAIRTFSLPQTKFLKISRIIILLLCNSVVIFNNLINGATNTGDSQHTAISFKNRFEARKFRFGKSSAKFMYFSFSFFSIKAIVRFI